MDNIAKLLELAHDMTPEQLKLLARFAQFLRSMVNEEENSKV